uniref:Uncharacterized protein n=1 Tax=Arundo donax TaxID=35708 RepID=A0A0A9B511_ARUDO
MMAPMRRGAGHFSAHRDNFNGDAQPHP